MSEHTTQTTTDVFIASGVTPDAVRTWYEVPEQVVDMLRATIDPDETFAECLMRLLLEREGTYRQVVRENQKLRDRGRDTADGRLMDALLAVRTEAMVLPALGGWHLANDTFEKVRAAIEGDDAAQAEGSKS